MNKECLPASSLWLQNCRFAAESFTCLNVEWMKQLKLFCTATGYEKPSSVCDWNLCNAMLSCYGSLTFCRLPSDGRFEMNIQWHGDLKWDFESCSELLSDQERPSSGKFCSCICSKTLLLLSLQGVTCPLLLSNSCLYQHCHVGVINLWASGNAPVINLSLWESSPAAKIQKRRDVFFHWIKSWIHKMHVGMWASRVSRRQVWRRQVKAWMFHAEYWI